MAVLDTTTENFNIPTQLIEPWVKTVSEGSVISTLSQSIPMLFGRGEAVVFGTDEAEYVGEGQNKGDSEYTSTVQTIEPFKFHKTVRWTEEVQWADEDHQMGVIDQVLAEIQPSLSRALDFGVIHAVNPKDGTPVTAMGDGLATATAVDASAFDQPYLILDEADRLVLEAGNLPSGLAMDPALAVQFAGVRDEYGRKIYPDISYGTAASQLENHRSSVSRTVSGKPVLADSGILGIVGDFSAVRWGIQKSIGLEVIRYGDPDGNGDLKRNNQIAFRAEVVYGWGIADLGAFAVITDGAADGGAEGN